MLRLARERPSLSIVSDQTGCPTWARNLAEVSRKVISRLSTDGPASGLQGIYHYCDGDAVSWYDFAREIFSIASRIGLIFSIASRIGLIEKVPEMTAVQSSDFPQIAERPLYSVLDTAKIRKDFGIEPAGLHQALQACLEEIAENE